MVSDVLVEAIENSWCLETRHPDCADVGMKGLSYGQCGVTALLIQEIYGGDILFNRFYKHVWNELPNSEKHDLTRAQFPLGDEIISDGKISREDMFGNELALKAKVAERYNIFRKKVLKFLNLKDFSFLNK
jgi:hypothetical protein